MRLYSGTPGRAGGEQRGCWGLTKCCGHQVMVLVMVMVAMVCRH